MPIVSNFIMQAAKSTGKLEEQIKDLTSQLEAKDEEIAKLQKFLKEITEYSVKEEGAKDIPTGQLPKPEEIPVTGNETIDKLTAENVKLKVVEININVIS